MRIKNDQQQLSFLSKNSIVYNILFCVFLKTFCKRVGGVEIVNLILYPPRERKFVRTSRVRLFCKAVCNCSGEPGVIVPPF